MGHALDRVDSLNVETQLYGISVEDQPYFLKREDGNRRL